MLAGAKDVPRMGGAEGCNSFDEIFLRRSGQISYDGLSEHPPGSRAAAEMVYLICSRVGLDAHDDFCRWNCGGRRRYTRAILNHLRIDELYLDHGRRHRVAEPGRAITENWRDVFLRG